MEVWMDIPEWEGLYQASNLGRIKSVGRVKGRRNEPDRIMIPKVTAKGYLRVTLSNCGAKKYKLVHRLVAQAFLPNPNNYKVVDHKDNNTQNAQVCNLQWATTAQNNKFSFDRGRPPVKSWLGKSGSNHNKSKKVKCTTLGIVFGSAHEAARELGLHQSHISEVCRGELFHKNGLVFNYM